MSRRVSQFAICLTVVGFLAQAATSEEGVSVVQGIVVDYYGQALSGASVELKSTSTPLTLRLETNKLGEFEFSPLSPGAYALSVKLEAFFDRQVDLNVPRGMTIERTIGLRVISNDTPPAATVIGRVRDSAGRPVKGARVSAIGVFSGALVDGASSTADGRFRFQIVDGGQYLFFASRPGFVSSAVTKAIEGDQVSLEFELKRDSWK